MAEVLLTWAIPLILFAIAAPFILRDFKDIVVYALGSVIWLLGAVFVMKPVALFPDYPGDDLREPFVYWIIWVSVFGIALFVTLKTIKKSIRDDKSLINQCISGIVAGVVTLLLLFGPAALITLMIVPGLH